MTIIAAYTDGKTWAMSSDTGSFSGDIVTASSTPKIWKTDNSLIGGCGSWRVLELAQASGKSSVYEIRDVLVKAEVTGDWEMLVVDANGVFALGDDFGIVRMGDGYGSAGIAEPIALGVLCAASMLKLGPVESVTLAAKVAIRHSTGAAGSVKILKGGMSERSSSKEIKG